MWINCDPTDFTYGSGGVNAIKEGKVSNYLDPNLNRLGFINEYSMSSIENDFNEFAEDLFLPENGFKEVVENYPKIRKKRKLIINFYNKLNKSMNEEYFNTILHTKCKTVTRDFYNN